MSHLNRYSGFRKRADEDIAYMDAGSLGALKSRTRCRANGRGLDYWGVTLVRVIVEQVLCQPLELLLIPVANRLFPAVPEGFATQARQFAQSAEVVSKLKDGAAIVTLLGNDREDLVNTVLHGRILEQVLEE